VPRPVVYNANSSFDRAISSKMKLMNHILQRLTDTPVLVTRSYRKYATFRFSRSKLDFDLPSARLTGDVKWPVSTPFENAVGKSANLSVLAA
jgi:hypothetical protein